MVSYYWKKQTKKGHLFAKSILDNVLVILRKLSRRWESEEFPLIIDRVQGIILLYDNIIVSEDNNSLFVKRIIS